MVLAVSAEAERLLVQMFRKHAMHRVYHAIAQGRVEARILDSSLVRDRGDRRRGSTKLPKVGKRAVTHVRPLEHFDGYTLIECRLETGRTHQIRIQLAEAGHPLCGEKVYNKPLFGKPIVDHSGAERQALHAAELGFNTHHRPGFDVQDTLAGGYGKAAGEAAGGRQEVKSGRFENGNRFGNFRFEI